jgi:iron complex transport system substrate-binding protein
VVALEPKTLADVQRVLRHRRSCWAARRAGVWQRIDAGVDAAARSLPPALRGTRVYFEVNSGPYAASESSFIGEMLRAAGRGQRGAGPLGPSPSSTRSSWCAPIPR